MRRSTIRRSPYSPRAVGQITVRRLCPELYLRDGTVAGTPILVAGTATGWPPGVNLPIETGTTATTAGGGFLTPFAMRFSFDQLRNFTELQGVFDYYRINWVKVFITYNHNSSTAGGTSQLPSIYYYHDRDDDIPVNPDILRERMGVRRFTFTADKRTLCIRIKPTMMMDAGTATTTVDAIITRPRFIDSTISNIEFFGCKGYFANALWPATAAGTNPVSSFKIDVQMSVTLKGVI